MFILILLCSINIALLFRSRNYLPLLISFVFFITAIYSYFGYFIFEYSRSASYITLDPASDETIYKSISHFLYFSFLISLPSLIFFKSKISFDKQETLAIVEKLNSLPQFYFLAVSLVSPILFVIWIGPLDVFFNIGYTKDINWAATPARLLLPFSCIAASFVRDRKLRYFLYIIIIIPPLAQTSRAVVLALCFIFIASQIRSYSFSYIKTVAFFVLFFILNYIVLNYRFNEIQGLFGHFLSFYNQGFVFSGFISSLDYILAYSINIYSHVLDYGFYTSEMFYASINPLPSFLVDTKSLELARVNFYIPYSALSELYMFLGDYIFILFIALGFFIPIISLVFKESSFSIKFTAILMFFYVFSMSLQYNLRGSFRLFTIIVFISVMMFVYKFLVSNFKKKV